MTLLQMNQLTKTYKEHLAVKMSASLLNTVNASP